MKKTKLFLLSLLFFALFVGHQSYAQFAFGGSIGSSVPLEKGDKAGFGIGLKGMYFLSPKLSAGLNFHRLGYSESSFSTSITAITPFINLFFTEEGFRPYIGLDAGVYRSTVSLLGISVSDSKFGIAPTLGALYNFTDNIALDINLKYGLIFQEGDINGYLPINIGVLYTIGK